LEILNLSVLSNESEGTMRGLLDRCWQPSVSLR